MQKKMGLLPKLLLGIIFGIIIGLISKSIEMYIPVRLLSTFSGIFGNFLKFIIPCIIIGFVAPGIADLGKSAGKMLGITALFAYSSTIIAGTFAYVAGSSILSKVIKVGETAGKSNIDLSPYFTIEMPPIMGVMTALVLAFVLGVGMASIKGKDLKGALSDFQSIVELVIKNVIIPFIPIHVAGIMAKLTTTGEIFVTIKAFSTVFAIIIPLQIIYVLLQYIVAWMFTKKSPAVCIKNMLPAYFTAIGTQSSAATIPITMQSARKNGIAEDVVDFVVPLCATIHLAGDTITLVLLSMGVMMIAGTVPTFSMMLPFILMLGVTMVAAPGIPGGGVMAALGLLEGMLGFTGAQQTLMIALHFAQDSFGTAANVTGDGAIALIVDKLIRKKNNTTLQKAENA
ncbi:dicarboxylate/amino acid:cation symporter [Crassaminicella indica]|uniref:Dicarboxylate/amino acid:cation symporter n=1 Tax=Crassaminicella indica TaxID=2855394 RepID=A0ABX8R8Y0_9CLOT|nr:dicarboxylate/amino acid:cation symporter [Crassaminicella indica]QXM05488.1 dicarboxylate/amino acid:cation symporter [Crassaminicella indica]